MSEKPKFMTHERIMAGEEYVSYSDYLMLERERDEAREILREIAEASGFDNIGNWARNKARNAIYR